MMKETMKARICELIENCETKVSHNVESHDVSERCETVLNQLIGLQITVWSRDETDKVFQLDCYETESAFFNFGDRCENCDKNFYCFTTAQFATMRDALAMQFAIISELIDESAA